MHKRVPILLALALLVPWSAAGQTSPVVPDDVWKALENEISGDISFSHLRNLTLYHAPNGSNVDFEAEAEWVAEKAREYGLEDVKLMWLGGGGRPWNVRSGEAWLVLGDEEKKLGDVLEHPLRVGVGSNPADLTAELIDVGEGTSEEDYEGKDVAGKIVFATGSLRTVQRMAVFDRGAAGIISSAIRRTGFPDQLPFLRISDRRDDKPGGFAWILTPREGELLRARLETAAEDKITPQARVKIDAFFQEERQGILEGWIRGTEIHDQQIVLTAHLQEERTSANDDRSGVANLLEIARALNKLIAEGKIERPRRDIRFWWVDEIGAQYRYFAEHPEEAKKMLVNLNQDMVGARQSAGYRVQFMSRTPWSRPSFVNDVEESILNAVVAGNTAYPLRQGSDNGDFSRPMVSALGTREPYRAQAVPFYDSTDHLPFNDGRVGVPGTSLTNWPDPYIHSSDDDLWQIDATQLRRNAFVVAATALTLSRLGKDDVSKLTALVTAGAQQRLARDQATALNLVSTGTADTAAERFKDAIHLLEAATDREEAALDSARLATLGHVDQMTPFDEARQAVRALSDRFRDQLNRQQSRMGGPAEPAMEDAEKKAAGLTPAWKATLLDDQTGKIEVANGTEGLHGHYSFEVRNLIDGKRTAYEIYRRVRAASLSAGEWYYGPVELDVVLRYLREMEKDGAIELVEAKQE